MAMRSGSSTETGTVIATLSDPVVVLFVAGM
jgi:hypothetical protein